MRGTFPRQVGALDLISEIRRGHLALPEFQRDFEWQDSQVEALLTTLLKGWPAGSLLFLEATSSMFFKPRRFAGGPAVSSSAVKTIVLDGQQRLTSLFHALSSDDREGYGSGITYAYLLDVTAKPRFGVDEVEESVTTFSTTQWKRLDQIAGHKMMGNRLVVPFFRLDSVTGFWDWREQVVRDLRSEFPRVGDNLRTVYDELFSNLHSYQFPAVFVDSEVRPEAVARIFERVNRNSEPLSTFDLLVAKTFTSGWNMRERWEDACLVHPRLEEFYGKDGTVVVQTLSLANPQRPSIRKGDVLDLDPEYIRDGWVQAVSANEHTLRRLSKVCGCLHPSFLPFDSLVPLYGGLGILDGANQISDTLLRRHFFLAAFGLRFSVAANTRVVEDFLNLNSVRPMGSFVDRMAQSWPVSASVLREATGRSHSAIGRGVAALMAWLSGLDEDLDNPVTLNIWERRQGRDWHLRAASTVVLPSDQARALRRADLLGEPIPDETRKLLQMQLVSEEWFEISSRFTDAQVESMISSRASKIADFLRENFGAIVED